MTALHRKLLRDLRAQRAPGLAVALVVACAVATFAGALGAAASLAAARDGWYDRAAFPHLFATARRAPEAVAARLAALPGVTSVETRVAGEALVALPGRAEPATLRLCSAGPGAPRLGALHLRAGRLLAPGRAGELLLGEAFAEANDLRPGDALEAMVNGVRQPYRVVGVVLSPEHVFAMRPGAVMNDDRHYGVAWTDREALAAALDLTGAFDEVVLRLAPGASVAPVIEAVDRLLAPHGGLGAYPRAEQTSHLLVSDEITQMRALAATLPPILLGVAAFLLAVVVARLVTVQRQQIATLEALGYGRARIAVHYVELAGAVVLTGAAGGALGAWWMANDLATTYARFYRFPALRTELPPELVALAAAVAVAGALAGLAVPLSRVLRIPPALAMQPPAPLDYRPTLLDRLPALRRLGPAARMIVRDLARRPLRTALCTLGTAAAVGTVVLAVYVLDAAEAMVRHVFERAVLEDAQVSFTAPVRDDAARALRGIPGVRGVEPVRAAPVRLHAGHRTYRTSLLGLDPDARLRRVVNAAGLELPLPARGVVLSRFAADRLGVRPGDTLDVEVLEGRRRTGRLRLAAVVDDLLGIQLTAPRAEVDALLGERLASGALLTLDPAQAPAAYQRLRATPRVGGIDMQRATRASLERMMDESMVWFAAVLTAVAIAVACGVVYVAARLAVAERERVLATLRVLGFSRGAVWGLVAADVSVQVLLALPAGWALGRALASFMAAVLASETVRLPSAVSVRAGVLAAAVVVAAAATVLARARAWVAELDLVAASKARE